jgi:hypothetical protein
MTWPEIGKLIRDYSLCEEARRVTENIFWPHGSEDFPKYGMQSGTFILPQDERSGYRL